MFDIVQHQVDEDFRRARRSASRNARRARLRRQPAELLPLEEVRSRIFLYGQRDLGLQTVPLDRIVGSESRAADFDREFLPLSENMQERWTRISRARYHDVALPPVELYKLGAIYFVRDGHHRISVARQHGQAEIDAHVVELASNVPLTPDLDRSGLVRKEAQSKFVAWSDLLRLRPGVVVPDEASEPESYDALIRHIEGHRYFLGLEEGREISREEAVVHGYDALYLPLVEAIRRNDIRKAFPGCTETSLYLRIMEHRYYMTEQAGHDPGPDGAALDYLRRFGSWWARRQIGKGWWLARPILFLRRLLAGRRRRCA